MIARDIKRFEAPQAHFNRVGGNQYNNVFNLDSKADILKQLQPADMDGSTRTGCLENTRTDILTLVINWASDSMSTHRALWLHGPAGSGKSTILTSLADHFRRSGKLGAFLFFERGVTERSNPTLVARTLAYQLASFQPEIGKLITAAIIPQSLISPIPSQFRDLIVDPLSSMESLPTSQQVVLLLDSLDECGIPNNREALLATLAEQSAHLPPWFRVVISSRPEIDIRHAFESQPHVRTMELDLTSTAVNHDILTFFRHHMNIIQKKRSLHSDWPGRRNIEALAGRASGLFIWASIACHFIDAHDPQKRLCIVLRGDETSTAEAALDVLYRKALEYSGEWDDEDFVADFKVVIGMILVLRNPLTCESMDSILANPDGRPSARTINQLTCILLTNPTVSFIHPSLADFFMNRARCDRDIWFFSPAPHERTLAILCLRRLDQVLHRDMSQWFPVDQDGNLARDVEYACIFWVDHICAIRDNLSEIEKLFKAFVKRHILHWFEAMGLLKRFSSTGTLLDKLSAWIQSNIVLFRSGHGLLDTVQYWCRFSREYESCIHETPMQVYSDGLLRDFKFIDAQEPLVSRPPTPNILALALVLPSPNDISTVQNYIASPRPRSASLHRSESMNSALSSRPASPDFTRHSSSRRLSRSSLDISRPPTPDLTRNPSSRRLSLSSLDISQSVSPHPSNSNEQLPVSRPASPARSRTASNRRPSCSSVDMPIWVPSSASISETESPSRTFSRLASALRPASPGDSAHHLRRSRSLLSLASRRQSSSGPPVLWPDSLGPIGRSSEAEAAETKRSSPFSFLSKGSNSSKIHKTKPPNGKAESLVVNTKMSFSQPTTALRPPPGVVPPFNGAPPPVPPGINPQTWGAGSWHFNPASWCHSPSGQHPFQNNAGWTIGSDWYDGIQTSIQTSIQTVTSFNPYKRMPRPPPAEYICTTLLSDNPLGLENVIPREKLLCTDGTPQAPWIWNPPPGLVGTDASSSTFSQNVHHESATARALRRDNPGEAFSSKNELIPTFSPHIIRTPQYYSSSRSASSSSRSSPSNNRFSMPRGLFSDSDILSSLIHSPT